MRSRRAARCSPVLLETLQLARRLLAERDVMRAVDAAAPRSASFRSAACRPDRMARTGRRLRRVATTAWARCLGAGASPRPNGGRAAPRRRAARGRAPADRSISAALSAAKWLMAIDGIEAEAAQIGDVPLEVAEARARAPSRSSVPELRLRHAAMHLERAHGRDDAPRPAGCRPALRHLMLKNFSAPRSAPKPASVTT